MNETASDVRIKAEVWSEDADDGEEMHVEFERTDTDEIALHTFRDGRGSIISTYFTREGAIAAARDLLKAASLR